MIKKINEKQQKVQKAEISSKNKTIINKFNAYSETAKKDMNNWTKFVSKHTAELTQNIAEKFKEIDEEMLKGENLKMCTYCKKFPIVGVRYECFVCPNFNICEECEKKYGEQHKHALIKHYASCQKK